MIFQNSATASLPVVPAIITKIMDLLALMMYVVVGHRDIRIANKIQLQRGAAFAIEVFESIMDV